MRNEINHNIIGRRDAITNNILNSFFEKGEKEAKKKTEFKLHDKDGHAIAKEIPLTAKRIDLGKSPEEHKDFSAEHHEEAAQLLTMRARDYEDASADDKYTDEHRKKLKSSAQLIKRHAKGHAAQAKEKAKGLGVEAKGKEIKKAIGVYLETDYLEEIEKGGVGSGRHKLGAKVTFKFSGNIHRGTIVAHEENDEYKIKPKIGYDKKAFGTLVPSVKHKDITHVDGVKQDNEIKKGEEIQIHKAEDVEIEKAQKHIRKYVGKNGKWVYVYENKKVESNRKKHTDLSTKIKTHQKELDDILSEQENDPNIELEGGPVADSYGKKMTAVDKKIDKIKKVQSTLNFEPELHVESEEEVHESLGMQPGQTLHLLTDVGKFHTKTATEIEHGYKVPYATEFEALNKKHKIETEGDVFNLAKTDKKRYHEFANELMDLKEKPKIEKGKTETKELVDEHEHLVNVLESESHEDDKQEAKKQKKELKEYKQELRKSEIAEAIEEQRELDEIEKGQIADRLRYDNFLPIKKTGQEIKDQTKSMLNNIDSQMVLIVGKISELDKELKTKPTQEIYQGNFPVDCNYKQYTWETSEPIYKDGQRPEPTEEQKKMQEWNKEVNKYYSLLCDHKALTIISENLDSKTKYDLNMGQLITLGF